MTNLEYIKTLDANDFIKFIHNKTNYMCMQCGEHDTGIWQTHCLRYYNSPTRLKCDECRVDWLNSEMGELEKHVEQIAIEWEKNG